MRTPLLVALLLSCPVGRAGADDFDYAIPIPPRAVVQEVPPIPESLRKAVKPYWGANFTAFEGWYGAGREMLVRADQVYHLRWPEDPATRPLTAARGRVFGAYPRPGTTEFLLAVDPDGREQNQFYLVDPSRGRKTRLTDAGSESFYPEWSPSGRFLAYSEAPYGVGRSSLRFLEPPGVKRLRDYAGLGVGPVPHGWSPDERRVAVTINEAGKWANNVLVVDVGTGRAEAVGTSVATAMALESDRKIPLRWSPDGRSLYWTTLRDSDFVRLIRYDLATKAETPIGPGIRWDVEEFALADDNERVAVIFDEDGSSALRVFSAEAGKELPAPRMPAGVASGLAFRPGSAELAFSLRTPGLPMRVHSFDLDRGTASRWKLGEDTPNPGATSDPEVVRFPGPGGEPIPALLTHPPARFAGPRPALIWLHGGPYLQCRPDHLGYLAYLVNELGVAVIRPNYRGSTGYGSRFECLDDGPRRGDAIGDIGALLDWVATRPDLDARRVAVSGGSYGGFLALAALARFGDRLVAGVEESGISDFAAHLTAQVEAKRAWSVAEFGDVADPKTAEFLRSISPLAAAPKIRKPLLVIHGDSDPRVDVAEAARIVAAVRANGVPVWCILGRGEGHSFQDHDNFEYRALAEIVFLRRYLLKPADR